MRLLCRQKLRRTILLYTRAHVRPIRGNVSRRRQTHHNHFCFLANIHTRLLKISDDAKIVSGPFWGGGGVWEGFLPYTWLRRETVLATFGARFLYTFSADCVGVRCLKSNAGGLPCSEESAAAALPASPSSSSEGEEEGAGRFRSARRRISAMEAVVAEAAEAGERPLASAR